MLNTRVTEQRSITSVKIMNVVNKKYVADTSNRKSMIIVIRVVRITGNISIIECHFITRISRLFKQNIVHVCIYIYIYMYIFKNASSSPKLFRLLVGSRIAFSDKSHTCPIMLFVTKEKKKSKKTLKKLLE
jgi:hypothetical protein